MRTIGARPRAKLFRSVVSAARGLPHVEAATRYDGSPVLRVNGVFMAGLAADASAEPGTLVVRATFEDLQLMLEEAPEIYYTTDYHRKHPVVLVRLSRIDRDALHDLLRGSWRLTMEKVRRGAASERSRSQARGGR